MKNDYACFFKRIIAYITYFSTMNKLTKVRLPRNQAEKSQAQD